MGMAPVNSAGIDGPVSETGQLIATIATFALALVALLYVVSVCRRDRVVWPLIITVAGTLTCLLEPLFDHLYGLWFPTEGQWTLFTTYGMHEPVWLPGAYLIIYGAMAVGVVKQLDAAPTMRTVWKLYAALAAVAFVGEISYIKVFEVYNYQDQQPFKVLGYPAFMGFVNSMSALIGGIAVWRLVPLLRGRQQALLFMIPPLAFALDAIGSGFLYLALRHSSENPSDLLLHLGAITVVIGGAATVRLMAMLLPADATRQKVGSGLGPAAARPVRRSSVKGRDMTTSAKGFRS